MFYPSQQTGDKLDKSNEAQENIDDTALDDAIEDIFVAQLQAYGYYQSDKESADNEEVDETEDDSSTTVEGTTASTDVDENKTSTKFKSDYFKRQLKSMERKVLGTDDDEGDSADDVCSMTAKLRKHKDYNVGKKPKHRLCPNRGIMENIAAKHQQKQGEEINNNRAKLGKVQLDIGDVGSIFVQGNTKAATDHSWLPIMVTKIIIRDSDNVNYPVCSRH